MNTPFIGRRVASIVFGAIPTVLSCAILSCAILPHVALAQTPSPNGAADLEVDGQPPSISEPPAYPEPPVPEELEIDIHQRALEREEQDLEQEQEQEQSVPENNETPEQDSPDQLEIP